MAYYLIFDNKFNFHSFTQKKNIVDEFLEQRKDLEFKVEKLNDELLAKMKEKLNSSNELIKHNGLWVNLIEIEEIEYSFYVLIEEIHGALSGFIELSSSVKFDNDEKHLIENFIRLIEGNLHQIELHFNSSESINQYKDILKIKRMIKGILRALQRRIDDNVLSNI